MFNYASVINNIPQTEPLPNQIPNNGGGYGYQIDKWSALDRFLIIGTEGGTYYLTETKLTVANCNNVIECIKEDSLRTVNRIVEISTSGRAHKNDHAIFALVLCTIHDDGTGRSVAYDNIHKVCRTGTHLFTFCSYVKQLRKWSAGLRRGVAQYYSQSNLAMQLIKYRQRNGWTHKDVLRLCHPHATTDDQRSLYSFAVGKDSELPIISAFKFCQNENSPTKEVINTLKEFKLPWEVLPTSKLTDPKIWAALIPYMGITALVRNLNKFALYGLTKTNLCDATILIRKRLTDAAEIKQSKIHPMTIFIALKTYAAGEGLKGSLTWDPVPNIVAALNEAFFKSFTNVEPTGKRILIGLDVSGSMAIGFPVTHISAMEACFAMSLILVKTEPNVLVVAFSNGLTRIDITGCQSLENIEKALSNLSFSQTDCALPIITANKDSIAVDAFIIFTDSETNRNSIHPSLALQQYRKKMKLDSKLIVCGTTATNISIADPKDKNMLDCVGFDAGLPVVINNFIRE